MLALTCPATVTEPVAPDPLRAMLPPWLWPLAEMAPAPPTVTSWAATVTEPPTLRPGAGAETTVPEPLGLVTAPEDADPPVIPPLGEAAPPPTVVVVDTVPFVVRPDDPPASATLPVVPPIGGTVAAVVVEVEAPGVALAFTWPFTVADVAALIAMLPP